LTKEAFRFLRADTELFLVPVVATMLLIALFAILILLVLATGMVTTSTAPDASYTVQGLVFLAGSYLLSAYVVALSRAAVTYTVAVRAHDGNATLGESLKVAFGRTPTLVVWALVSSTVGLILSQIAERSEFIGRLISRVFGVAWDIATYFVVPAMILEKKGTFSAMKQSATVFGRAWGETVVTQISTTLVFLVAHLVMMGLFMLSLFVGVTLHVPAIFLLGALVWIIWLAAALALHSVLSSIIATLLYIYATATVPPSNFNSELLGQIVARTQKTPITPTVPVVS
jgi:hypothetical protein